MSLGPASKSRSRLCFGRHRLPAWHSNGGVRPPRVFRPINDIMGESGLGEPGLHVKRLAREGERWDRSDVRRLEHGRPQPQHVITQLQLGISGGIRPSVPLRLRPVALRARRQDARLPSGWRFLALKTFCKYLLRLELALLYS